MPDGSGALLGSAVDKRDGPKMDAATHNHGKRPSSPDGVDVAAPGASRGDGGGEGFAGEKRVYNHELGALMSELDGVSAGGNPNSASSANDGIASNHQTVRRGSSNLPAQQRELLSKVCEGTKLGVFSPEDGVFYPCVVRGNSGKGDPWRHVYNAGVEYEDGELDIVDLATARFKILGREEHSTSEGEGTCEVNGPTLRSERSRQRQIQKNTAAKNCERCGVDDVRYKLRACSGCKLALYCSVTCQKAARGSHRRICDIVSELPPSGGDRLVLTFDKDEKNDFDAVLRYATKYMDNMRRLRVDLRKMDDATKLKLTAKRLSSLLKSKKGALDTVFLISDDESQLQVPAIFENSYEVLQELHGLKQLCLQCMSFDDVQCICNIIRQQSQELVFLSLPALDCDWNRASCRKTFALAVSSCKKLVTLDLTVNAMQDSELEVLLNDLPNLRSLCLRRNMNYSSLRGLTDKSCAVLARKCPLIQELRLDCHDKVSVKGIRKLLKGCIHLRSFHTATLNLSCKDILSLLNIAPQLLCLYLNGDIDLSDKKINEIIEAIGGRTLIMCGDGIHNPGQPGAIISAKTMDKYHQQKDVFHEIMSRYDDPEIGNVWKDMEKTQLATKTE